VMLNGDAAPCELDLLALLPSTDCGGRRTFT